MAGYWLGTETAVRSVLFRELYPLLPEFDADGPRDRDRFRAGNR